MTAPTQRVEFEVGHRIQHGRVAPLCRRLLLNLCAGQRRRRRPAEAQSRAGGWIEARAFRRHEGSQLTCCEVRHQLAPTCTTDVGPKPTREAGHPHH